MKIQIFILATAFYAVQTSCVSTSKLNRARERVGIIEQRQSAEEAVLRRIATANQERLRDKKIDSVLYTRIAFVTDSLDKLLASMRHDLTKLDGLLSGTQPNTKSGRNNIKERLDLAILFEKDSIRRNRVYQMLEEGLDNTNYSLFSLAAFFGPGKYAIPEGKEAIADSAFGPLIDSVISFSSRFSDLPQKAILVILGYADGTGFDPQSILYTELVRHIGKKEVNKQELNKMLSSLRAQSLLRQLRKQMDQKLAGKSREGILEIEFIGLGRGEVFPFPFINDYKDDDERRRIVLCYWVVLPR